MWHFYSLVYFIFFLFASNASLLWISAALPSYHEAIYCQFSLLPVNVLVGFTRCIFHTVIPKKCI